MNPEAFRRVKFWQKGTGVKGTLEEWSRVVTSWPKIFGPRN